MDVLKPLAPVILHTAVIYLFLIMALRLLGFRQLGQLTTIDLLIILLLGSAVETSMVNANTSLQAGIVSASVLMVLNWLVSRIVASSPVLRAWMVGRPVLLVSHGRLIEDHAKRLGLTPEDVLAALRERGAGRIEDVRYAVHEIDGSINVIRRDGTAPGSHG